MDDISPELLAAREREHRARGLYGAALALLEALIDGSHQA